MKDLEGSNGEVGRTVSRFRPASSTAARDGDPASVAAAEPTPASVAAAVALHPAGRTRTRVLLGVADLAFHQEVLDFLDRDSRVDAAGAVGDATRLVRLAKDVPAHAVVLCPTLASSLRREDLERLPSLVVTEEMTVPALQDAIDLGTRAVFAWPEERAELAASLRRLDRPEAGRTGRRGTVVAVMGAREGPERRSWRPTSRRRWRMPGVPWP